MRCIYINLDSAIGRRSDIEKNFSEKKKSGWLLSRLNAIDSSYVAAKGIKGRIRDAEKACFLSHREAIRCGTDSTAESIMILEDDTRFGAHSFQLIEDSIRAMTGIDWDLLFTDLTIPAPATMISLIPQCNQLIRERKVKILNLKTLVFAGTGAYIVNGKSLGKLLSLLDNPESIEMPYDLFLRKLIYEDKLSGFVTFPFITTISETADTSQLQPSDTGNTDLIWGAFRRLCWLERSTAKLEPLVDFIDRTLCDSETKLFTPILSACLSKEFVSK